MEEYEQRPFQEFGSNFLIKYKRVLLGDQPGLGKTNQCLVACKDLKAVHILILAPKNALWTWKNEMRKWYPGLLPFTYIVSGTPTQRRRFYQEIDITSLGPRIIITTFVSAFRDMADRVLPSRYDVLICDEIHKRLRNRKTKTLTALKLIHSPYLFLLTGTPTGKGPQDIWPALHVIDPRKFSSYWRFVERYTHISEGPFGKEIYGVRNPVELRKLLSTIVIRRYKDQLKDEMPPKDRQPIFVEMDKAQRKLYETLVEEMMLEVGDEVVVASNALALSIKLRKLLVSPKLLSRDLPWGASVDALIEKSSEIENGHFVVITFFRDGCDVIKERLIKEGYMEEEIFIFRGGLSAEEVGEFETNFKACKGVAICTIQFAQSFNLETASYCFVVGPSFDPGENEQGEDRVHRISSKNPVTIYYIINRDTVETHIIDVNNNKLRNANTIFKNLETLKGALHGTDN